MSSLLPKLNKTWSITKLANEILLYSVLILSIGIALLIYRDFNRDERVVLVPPGISEKVGVSKTNADAGYLKSWGLYATTLIGNLTPKNISFVLEELSKFMSSESYASIRKQLIALSKDANFKSWVGSTHFEPNEVIYEADTNKVFVSGYMTDINTTGKKSETQIVYEMKIVIENSKPKILDLTSYAGSEPRTLKWLELHPATTSESKE